MAHRVLITTCVLVTAASLALVGMFWIRSDRAALALARALAVAEDQRRLAEQALADSNRRMVETFAQNQSANSEMLKQLQSMAKATQSPAAPDWIPVSFKLTEETLDGPSVVGCEVQIGPGFSGFNKAASIRRLSDSAGVVDFGVVRPGDWSFRVRRPWDENEHAWQTTGSINVLPGSKVFQTIICPKAPPDTPPIKVKIDWPPDLTGKELCIFATFDHTGIIYQPPTRWVLVSNSFRRALIGPGARNTTITNNGLKLWTVAESHQVNATLLDRSAAAPTKQAIETETGNYRLVRLTVMRRGPLEDKQPFVGEGFDVIASAAWHADDPHVPDQAANIVADTFDPGSDRFVGTIPIPAVDVPSTYWRSYWAASGQKTSQAKPVSDGQWTISLPDELIAAVREKLKAEPAAKTKQETPH